MIKTDLIYYYGKEIILVRLLDGSLAFAKVQGQNIQFAPLEGLKFSESGMLKEMPELKNLPFDEMKKKAIQRIKEKIKSMKEAEQVEYLKDDLGKHGYLLKFVHKQGFRPMTYEKWEEQNRK